jgi:hypothetical protein
MAVAPHNFETVIANIQDCFLDLNRLLVIQQEAIRDYNWQGSSPTVLEVIENASGLIPLYRKELGRVSSELDDLLYTEFDRDQVDLIYTKAKSLISDIENSAQYWQKGLSGDLSGN